MKERSLKSSQQFMRYILVGGFNTVFGYSLFALLNWLSRGLGSYNYIYAAIVGNFIGISVAFLGYKWFVFRTRGNYLVEYTRCFGVYGSSAPQSAPPGTGAIHRCSIPDGSHNGFQLPGAQESFVQNQTSGR